MKRYVIYSAICGNYDTIRQPVVVDSRFDYILFTNEIEEKYVGIWQIRKIAYSNPDNTRICRYIKTHPEELLPEYEVSIWMDSNVQITTDYIYYRVNELENDNVLVSSMWHPTRCAYREAFDVVFMLVEHEKIVTPWCHRLFREGYPRENGLCETNVLYRKHLDKRVIDMDSLWWDCIKHYSRRDQLSFNYSLWKTNIPLVYLMGATINVNNTEHFSIMPHNNLTHNQCSIMKNEAWLMRYCWKDRTKKKHIEELYYKLWSMPCPQMLIYIFGQLYRLKYLLK